MATKTISTVQAYIGMDMRLTVREYLNKSEDMYRNLEMNAGFIVGE